MKTKIAALYARVSSQQQREEETIGSQLAALREYAAAHGYVVPDEWIFQDEGYSGAILLRPGLEALRDLASQGQLEAVLVYAPDRLARKYAYQVLLVEELRRCGVEVLFLNSSRGDRPEDELLLQFQGMIAEYERAQIAERTRRGKIHRARGGDVSVLSAAPYGYRYVRKSDSHPASYEIIESQARVVHDIFRLYTREAYSIARIARHLSERGVPTQKLKRRWNRSTVWGILRNPAYTGRAAFAKTQVTDRLAQPTRWIRRRRGTASLRPAREDRSPELWIEIAVPAIIDETTFALACEQLERNKRLARRRTKEPSLLQGLLVCQQCGYSWSRVSTKTFTRKHYYYRCMGSDNYRWEKGRLCSNKPVHQDYLDQLVCDAVVELLANPALVRRELERRLTERRSSSPAQKQREQLQRELARYQRASRRLIEAYQEELIPLEELRERISSLRQRTNDASAQLNAVAAQIHDHETYLRLAQNFETFLASLHERAQTLSVEERQKVLRLVVKEVHMGLNSVVIKHSIPPADSGPAPSYPLRLGSQGRAACAVCKRRDRRPRRAGQARAQRGAALRRDVSRSAFCWSA